MSSIVIKSLLSAAFVLSSLMPAVGSPAMPLVTGIEQPKAERAGVIEVKNKHRNRAHRQKRHNFRHHKRPKPRHHVRPGYLNRDHINYCYNRYRSYREYDNTFQPYHGRRRICRSRYY